MNDQQHCSSSAPELLNQDDFLLNSSHFNVETPQILLPNVRNLVDDPYSLSQHSLDDQYMLRDLLFPPKNSQNPYCHSEMAGSNGRPVELSIRLHQSCPQLTTQ